jgi:hypothetical protein
MTIIFYSFRFTWMISFLVVFSCACVKFLGNDGKQVPDVHDGRTNLFLSYPSQANEAGHLRTLSQVHKELDEEIQYG